MNKKQTNQIFGWKAVRNVLSANKAIWQGLPAFSRAEEAFNNCWDLVHSNGGIQDQGTGWITKQKNDYRTRAIQLSLRAACNLKAWAEDHGESQVKAVANLNKSTLEHVAEPDLSRIIERLIDLSETHLDNLKDYGTDKAFLELYKEVSAGFIQGVAAPKSQRSGCKTASGNIAAAIVKGNQMLERMEDLLHNFADDHADFVSTYLYARSAVHHGERHLKSDEDGGSGHMT